MITKYLLSAALLASFVAPAFAATTTTTTAPKNTMKPVWYVVESTKTMKCSVTTTKPDGKKFTDVTANPTAKPPVSAKTFATKALAIADMKIETTACPTTK
jgi:hypothetical protein